MNYHIKCNLIIHMNFHINTIIYEIIKTQSYKHGFNIMFINKLNTLK